MNDRKDSPLDLSELVSTHLVFLTLEINENKVKRRTININKSKREEMNSRWLTMNCSMLSLVRLEVLRFSTVSLRSCSCSDNLRLSETTSFLKDCSYTNTFMRNIRSMQNDVWGAQKWVLFPRPIVITEMFL